MSVVDGTLKVYGIDNFRIADGSIMPRITSGNRMAPCFVIGERAAEIFQTEYTLQTSVIQKGGKYRDTISVASNVFASRKEVVL